MFLDCDDSYTTSCETVRQSVLQTTAPDLRVRTRQGQHGMGLSCYVTAASGSFQQGQLVWLCGDVSLHCIAYVSCRVEGLYTQACHVQQHITAVLFECFTAPLFALCSPQQIRQPAAQHAAAWSTALQIYLPTWTALLALLAAAQ
jgi:hypothetical protein